MAPVRWTLKLSALALMLVCLMGLAKGQCTIPIGFHGDWYGLDFDGSDFNTSVSQDKWGDLACIDIKKHDNSLSDAEGVNATLLMKKIGGAPLADCYRCVDVLYRTKNVLQVRTSGCLTRMYGVQMCPGYDELPSVDEVITYFRQSVRPVNCITTFEGQYQFNYEVYWGGGGICDNPYSQITACQDPGSPYIDNEIFFMTAARCPEVPTSYPPTAKYLCMGSWFAMVGQERYTYAAIADVAERDLKQKFKCLITNNKKYGNNTVRWGMSRFSECHTLHGLYDVPVRLVLKPIPPRIVYSEHTEPQCNLPRNISGEWFTQGIQIKSNVIINDTHIKYFTRKNEFEYEETYLSCQYTQGTRYLMTKVTVGKCETDLVCYDFLPIQDGIVRYRVGKPSQLTFHDWWWDADIRQRKFEEMCNSTSSGNDINGKYQALIRE